VPPKNHKKTIFSYPHEKVSSRYHFALPKKGIESADDEELISIVLNDQIGVKDKESAN